MSCCLRNTENTGEHELKLHTPRYTAEAKHAGQLPKELDF